MTTTDDPRLLFALLIWKNKQTNIKQQQQVEAGIQVTRQRLQFLLMADIGHFIPDRVSSIYVKGGKKKPRNIRITQWHMGKRGVSEHQLLRLQPGYRKDFTPKVTVTWLSA
ncbi:uncharacterized protein [Macaca nemestrina]|uniref:uncharacterized protein isoform X4 n=1 Tax=Macaca nemestrina TaxID=9545 RepID=UPI0039B8B91F